MLPDLRFVIGALIATVLLGVTLFGVAATMHVSYQSKVSPLETSRMLAYTPEGRHRIFDIPAPRADSPFANIVVDPNPVPLRQQSPEPTAEPAGEPAPLLQTAASVAPALPPPAIAEPASLPPSGDDADTVDERAVVDPPLPLDNDAPAQTAEPAPAAPSPEPAAAANAPIETLPATAPPVVEAPAVPVAAPDVQQVGSIPPATTDAAPEARPGASITEARETRKAKRARKTAKTKRPVRRARVPPVAQSALPGFPLGSTSNADRPAIGFWPLH